MATFIFLSYRNRSAGGFGLLLLLVLSLIAAVANSAETTKVLAWRLQAYHLHHHADGTTAAASDAAPVLLSERDLLSDSCALDTVVTALAAKKNSAVASTTQSVSLHRQEFVPVRAVVNPVTRRTSSVRENDSGMPESAASTELRKRDAAPTQLHAVGLVDLGVFQAESVEAAKTAISPLTDVDGEDDGTVLPVLTDPRDETERPFDVSFFLGDFTRTLCLGAAVYANAKDVGNRAAAIAVWVPHSVSPACAMRLSPFLRGSAGLSLTGEDLLQEWPLSQQQRCHLSQGHRFGFTFTPSQAQAKMPSFCAYEMTTAGVTVAPTPGTRRQLKCEVYVDLQVLTWYSETLAEIHANDTVVKIAAAVTEVVVPARGTAPSAQTRASLPPYQADQLAAFTPQEESNQSRIAHPAAAREERFPRFMHPLASTTNRVGEISRYKGTLRCTRAAVGRGFWFSGASECVEMAKERLTSNTDNQHRRFSLVRDCLLLLLMALAVAGFAGVLTGRVVKTVRSSRRRPTLPRW
ncbi:hypothetical protein ABB37_00668 [Leptomonas pyrrhocoris]|uniref:Uncharacterized protein n=1 Tax=Leptomonas pyrrhocoris TaxID=157538 RepID=A0A0N0E0J5_LEPPY|nr:hypothetical protein ABB37_00668 [Leptomonas pyrrhocoris]KPA86522.1 hypothetical protein ABB37_00668 [Leptomonas pyrrhocoris]|eukprot:XP_015664961.1 hypothetical protein ABB37_00668 [Leptomonas pyrrhocoris]